MAYSETLVKLATESGLTPEEWIAQGNAIQDAEAAAGRRATEAELASMRAGLTEELQESRVKAGYEAAVARKAELESQGYTDVKIEGKVGGEYTIVGAPKRTIELAPIPFAPPGQIETATYPEPTGYAAKLATVRAQQESGLSVHRETITTEGQPSLQLVIIGGTKKIPGELEMSVDPSLIKPVGGIKLLQKEGESRVDFEKRVDNVIKMKAMLAKGGQVLEQVKEAVGMADTVTIRGVEVPKSEAYEYIKASREQPLVAEQVMVESYARESNFRTLPQGELVVQQSLAPVGVGSAESYLYDTPTFKSGAELISYSTQQVGRSLGLIDTPIYQFSSELLPSFVAGVEESIKGIGTLAYKGVEGLSSIRWTAKGLTWGKSTIAKPLLSFESRVLEPLGSIYQPEAFITTTIPGMVSRFVGQAVGEEILLGPAQTYLWGLGVKGIKKIKGAIKYRGLTGVTPETIFAKEVLEGKAPFATSKSVEESLEAFSKSDWVVSASPRPISGTSVIKPQKPAQLYNIQDVGIYVSPMKKGQPFFLRIAAQSDDMIERTINPIKAIKSLKEELTGLPTVTGFKVTGVERYPRSIIKEAGFETIEQYGKKQALTGKAFITKRSEIGLGAIKPQMFKLSEEAQELTGKTFFKEIGTRELEAVIPVDTKFTKPELIGYTIVKGQRVGIRRAETIVGDGISDLTKKIIKGDSLGKIIFKEQEQLSRLTKPIYRPVIPVRLPALSSSKELFKTSYEVKNYGELRQPSVSEVSSYGASSTVSELSYSNIKPSTRREPSIYQPIKIREPISRSMVKPITYRPPTRKEDYRPTITPSIATSGYPYRTTKRKIVTPKQAPVELQSSIYQRKKKIIKPSTKKGIRKTRYEVSFAAAALGITGKAPTNVFERTLGLRPIIGKTKKKKGVSAKELFAQTIKI